VIEQGEATQGANRSIDDSLEVPMIPECSVEIKMCVADLTRTERPVSALSGGRRDGWSRRMSSGRARAAG
jgi:hypothetical protein